MAAVAEYCAGLLDTGCTPLVQNLCSVVAAVWWYGSYKRGGRVTNQQWRLHFVIEAGASRQLHAEQASCYMLSGWIDCLLTLVSHAASSRQSAWLPAPLVSGAVVLLATRVSRLNLSSWVSCSRRN